jgi:hypothetical protein
MQQGISGLIIRKRALNTISCEALRPETKPMRSHSTELIKESSHLRAITVPRFSAKSQLLTEHQVRAYLSVFIPEV